MDPSKPGRFKYSNIQYCFLFEPFYIGKGSKNRYKSHLSKSSLKNKNYKNSKIKSILNSNLSPILEILESNLSEEESLLKEISLISEIGRSDIEKGPLTNLTDGGDGASNLIIRKTRKRVYQFNLKGDLIKEYDSLTNASVENNLFISDISKCCKHKSNTHGGFHWSFKRSSNQFIINKSSRIVNQFDLNDNLVNSYSSISEASKSTGFRSSYISRCCSKKLIKYGDFYFRYANDDSKLSSKNNKTRSVIRIFDNYITIFKSIKEASKELNLTTKSIISRCRNPYLFDDIYLIYKDEYINGITKESKHKGNGEKKVYKIDHNGEIVNTYNSILDTLKSESISRSYLWKCIKEFKSINGFKYQYTEKKESEK